MVLEAHGANNREGSRQEKADIGNATFTKSVRIIHARHLEIPQHRTLPGEKHSQKEKKTEEKRSKKNHENGERKETATKLRRQDHVHA